MMQLFLSTHRTKDVYSLVSPCTKNEILCLFAQMKHCSQQVTRGFINEQTLPQKGSPKPAGLQVNKAVVKLQVINYKTDCCKNPCSPR